MNVRNSEYRFSPLVIGLHWLTVLLIIAVYASMELRGLAPKGALRDAMKSLHYLLGLSVLVIVVIRIGVRIQAGGGCAEFCVNGQSTAGESLLVRKHNDNQEARSTARTAGQPAGRLQEA
ncbi:MAG: cytochrome b/b6 domain-containing protein [Stenotrophomonas sp.]